MVLTTYTNIPAATDRSRFIKSVKLFWRELGLDSIRFQKPLPGRISQEEKLS
jgi:hypothetical protein